MDKSLILYAEHEFNASTFAGRVIAGTGSDMHSCITGAIGALRGPKHGGANEVAMDIISRYRSEEHTSELQSLMRISYAVFCLKKKTKTHDIIHTHIPT